MTRDQVQALIDLAFHDVTREGGISWSESELIDHYENDPEKLRAARMSDKDRSWRDLVDDPDWLEVPGVGGFSFVDPIGFRYYLPAAMTRGLANPAECELDFRLTKPKVLLRDYAEHQWSALDIPQQRAVAEFVRYMMENQFEGSWEKAWASHWRQVCLEDAVETLKKAPKGKQRRRGPTPVHPSVLDSDDD